jgi:hypothetical protein
MLGAHQMTDPTGTWESGSSTARPDRFRAPVYFLSAMRKRSNRADRLGAHLDQNRQSSQVLISRRHSGVMSPALSIVAFPSGSHPPVRSI